MSMRGVYALWHIQLMGSILLFHLIRLRGYQQTRFSVTTERAPVPVLNGIALAPTRLTNEAAPLLLRSQVGREEKDEDKHKAPSLPLRRPLSLRLWGPSPKTYLCKLRGSPCAFDCRAPYIHTLTLCSSHSSFVNPIRISSWYSPSV